MSTVVLSSRALRGIKAFKVAVEVSLSPGLPRMVIVGLAETTVREAEHRVRAAIVASGFAFPLGRLVINLAPADLPKDTSRLDLPIAIGILLISNQIDRSFMGRLGAMEFVGELSLTGALRSVPGTLPIAVVCSREKRMLICPSSNREAVAVVHGSLVRQASHLVEVVKFIQGEIELKRPRKTAVLDKSISSVKLSSVHGQKVAKRAVKIAVSGGHNLMLVGPPGTGKTMIAQSVRHLLPPLNEKDSIESACIYSVAKWITNPPKFGQRPFRAPHHSCTAAALLGGGSIPRPGELSLAHHGVLFLDEMTEFKRPVLDNLREPLESGKINITRSRYSCDYPARCMLIGAMNPCPCGYLGDKKRECGKCTTDSIVSFRRKLSGPIIDRFDIQVELNREKIDVFTRSAEEDDQAHNAIAACRSIQINRQGGLNAYLDQAAIQQFCHLSDAIKKTYLKLTETMHLSARASIRLLRVARTISDYEGKEAIDTQSLFEASGYRVLDRYGS